MSPRADARDALERELRSARKLGLVPIGVGLLLGALLLPRRDLPDDVPVPIASRSALQEIERTDRELADRTSRAGLPGSARALGSAIRAFHALEAQAQDASLVDMGKARHALDVALVDASADGDGALLGLRAVQLQIFVAEIRRFEQTGAQSDELAAVGGGFVRLMTAEGWCHDRSFVADDAQLQALFKQMWNGLLGLERRSPFALSRDEQRSLFALYLSHPHASTSARQAAAAARRAAPDASACEAVDAAERAAVERWRLERIDQLASLDPDYPASYARGVSALRGGNALAAAKAFSEWLQEHPDGPYSLRARTYLRLAMAESPTD